MLSVYLIHSPMHGTHKPCTVCTYHTSNVYSPLLEIIMYNRTVAYNSAMAYAAKNAEELRALQSLVIEEVHPSQFSALPPSPKEIKAKGRLLGLEVKRYSF